MAKIQTIEILDIENVKLEKLRYQKNSLAYILGFAAIIFSVLASFVALNSLRPDFTVALKILMNIGILLIGFLSCEKVKNYKEPYQYFMFGFSAICVFRIFWAPARIIKGWNLLQSGRDLVASGDVEGGNALVLKAQTYIGASLNATSSSSKGLLPQSGYLRATLCIVFLVVAAVFFALSGYVAYSKTRKLKKYLDSLKNEELSGR